MSSTGNSIPIEFDVRIGFLRSVAAATSAALRWESVQKWPRYRSPRRLCYRRSPVCAVVSGDEGAAVFGRGDCGVVRPGLSTQMGRVGGGSAA